VDHVVSSLHGANLIGWFGICDWFAFNFFDHFVCFCVFL
jgi:hypothetical protein